MWPPPLSERGRFIWLVCSDVPYGFQATSLLWVNTARRPKHPIPQEGTDAKTRVRISVIMRHMVALDILGISAAHGEMVRSVVRQVISEIPLF